MKEAVRKFETAYDSSLQECIDGAGEIALQHGYELGRQAVRDGLGVIDILSAHGKALLSHLSRAATAEDCARIVKTAHDLLAECLAPFELTHRGFIEVESLNIKLEESIAQSKRAEAALRKSEERSRLLSMTAGRLLRADDPQTVVEDLCRDVMAYLDCQAFFNFLCDEKAGRLHLNSCAGIPEEDARAIEWLDYGVAVCGCVAQQRQRIIAEDILHTPDVRTDLVKSYGIQAYCCHPLMAQGRLIGTLSFGTKTRLHFKPEEVELMRTVADQVSVAMQRKQGEEAIKERTVQLEAAYREIESFSYSVSHDLRAPLRAIDGFSLMLLKKHGDQFDKDTLRKFNVIRSNAQTMGQLIDDILTISRLGRKEMSIEKLDMSAIVREIWKELETINPGRNMAITVNGMPEGYGDGTLIRQAYLNLLGNAVKFSKYREKAIVEAGGHNKGNEHVYYIRDNGVGFDMAYYDKLFGVFQRLHKADEFEGTGVGLATVERVIKRHGGRVWAEGKVNEGATFYFSLPLPHTRTT